MQTEVLLTQSITCQLVVQAHSRASQLTMYAYFAIRRTQEKVCKACGIETQGHSDCTKAQHPTRCRRWLSVGREGILRGTSQQEHGAKCHQRGTAHECYARNGAVMTGSDDDDRGDQMHGELRSKSLYRFTWLHGREAVSLLPFQRFRHVFSSSSLRTTRRGHATQDGLAIL